MKLFFNNKLVDSQKAMVSIFDHGFLYGIGLFETFRTYNGEPCLLAEHLGRLNKSCEQLGIHYVSDEKLISTQIQQLLKENELREGYFRLTVSAGTGELGLPQTDYEQPTIVLMAKALPPAKSFAEWSKGKLAICLNTRRNSPEADVRYKSLHYMNNVIAKRELRLSYPEHVANAEGVMLNEAGYLTEGIVSNIFFRKQHTVYTPAISTGILPGITREFVIGLCKQNNIEVIEGCYDWNSLLSADEIWLTNSIQEIIPVTSLISNQGQYIHINNGVAGEYTVKLQLLYEKSFHSQVL